MTAREFLNQAFRLDQQISSKVEQIEVLNSLAQQVTTSFEQVPISHTGNVRSLEDVTVRLAEAKEELNRQILTLLNLHNTIASVISQVNDPDGLLILEKRYLCLQSWDQIATDMDYSRRWVLNHHKLAVEEVDKILANEEVSA